MPNPIPHPEAEAMAEALERADKLIDAMSNYIGQMALPAEFFANLNQHWLLMERRRRALSSPETP